MIVREVYVVKREGEPMGLALAGKMGRRGAVVARVHKRTCAWRANLFLNDTIVDAHIGSFGLPLKDAGHTLTELTRAGTMLLRVKTAEPCEASAPHINLNRPRKAFSVV